MNGSPPLHVAFKGVPYTLYECQLSCAITLYITFEDGTPIDNNTLDQIVGASSGLQNMNCAGLVDHLKRTNDVYPQVLNGGKQWAKWARHVWNQWLDPAAAPVGSWP